MKLQVYRPMIQCRQCYHLLLDTHVNNLTALLKVFSRNYLRIALLYALVSVTHAYLSALEYFHTSSCWIIFIPIDPSISIPVDSNQITCVRLKCEIVMSVICEYYSDSDTHSDTKEAKKTESKTSKDNNRKKSSKKGKSTTRSRNRTSPHRQYALS